MPFIRGVTSMCRSLAPDDSPVDDYNNVRDDVERKTSELLRVVPSDTAMRGANEYVKRMGWARPYPSLDKAQSADTHAETVDSIRHGIPDITDGRS